MAVGVGLQGQAHLAARGQQSGEGRPRTVFGTCSGRLELGGEPPAGRKADGGPQRKSEAKKERIKGRREGQEFRAQRGAPRRCVVPWSGTRRGVRRYVRLRGRATAPGSSHRLPRPAATCTSSKALITHCDDFRRQPQRAAWHPYWIRAAQSSNNFKQRQKTVHSQCHQGCPARSIFKHCQALGLSTSTAPQTLGLPSWWS